VDRSHHDNSLEYLMNITKADYLMEECYALNFIVQLKRVR